MSMNIKETKELEEKIIEKLSETDRFFFISTEHKYFQDNDCIFGKEITGQDPLSILSLYKAINNMTKKLIMKFSGLSRENTEILMKRAEYMSPEFFEFLDQELQNLREKQKSKTK